MARRVDVETEEEEEFFSDRFVWDLQGIKRLAEWVRSRDLSPIEGSDEEIFLTVIGDVERGVSNYEDVLKAIDKVEDKHREKLARDFESGLPW